MTTSQQTSSESSSGQLLSQRRSYITAGLLIVISLALFVWLVVVERARACPIRVDGECIKLERADTSQLRERGLSGREEMPQTEGMLFAFSFESEYCMWMKGMLFPVDMIWVDQYGEIVHIEADVPPESYPQSFCPAQPAQYVIELNAGLAERAGLEIGQQLPL